MGKTMALLGRWDWNDTTSQTGITVCEYQENGEIKPLGDYYTKVKVGSPVVRSDKNVLYFLDESKHTEDRRNEGGYVYAARLVGEEIIPLNRKKTYSPNPSYCAIDQEQKYLIVVHHASTRSIATKMYRDGEGVVRSRIIYDDAAVDLFKLEEDGSLGELTDYACHEPIGTKMSLLHGVYRIPDSDIFLVTDKGLDRLYSYRINKETEKLELLNTLEVSDCARPKYLCFVPGRNLFYCCYEKKLDIGMVQYDENTGKMQLLGEFPLQIQDLDVCGTQDIVLSADQKRMYVVVTGYDKKAAESDTNNGLYHLRDELTYIAAYDTSDLLHPVFLQCLSSEGMGARSCALTPDNRFVLVFNPDGNVLSRFAIGGDGLLSCAEIVRTSHPECITFFEMEPEISQAGNE